MMDIFPGPIRWVLTSVVIPVAFINYYPGHVLLRRGAALGFPTIMVYMYPGVGTVPVLLATLLASHSVTRYRSAGSRAWAQSFRVAANQEKAAPSHARRGPSSRTGLTLASTANAKSARYM